jgi:hypothetical protein
VSGRVAVIGANAVGCAATVDLTSAGNSVVLCTGGQGRLEYTGVFGTGHVEVETATSVGDAVGGADVVVVATFDLHREHREQELLDALDSAQTVVFLRGGSLASIRLSHTAGKGRQLPTLVELSCFPYSSRLVAPAAVHVKTKRVVAAAALQADATENAIEQLSELGLRFRAADDVLHCALSNPNFVLHPPALLTNLGAYERSDPVEHEGLTESSRRLVAALDGEHRALMSAYGYAPLTLEELVAQLAPERGAPTGDPWPAERLLRRFFDEDVVVGLCLLGELARAAALETPVLDSLVRAFGAALAPDVWANRFRLGDVGWSDAGVESIRASLGRHAVAS